MNQLAARLSGATKTFETHTAVSKFDLEIPKGSIYGLLGPNGSGKTTTIRMIMGILLPDHGSVELFGGVPDFARRSRVGYLPEERGVYEKMKVVDQLVFPGLGLCPGASYGEVLATAAANDAALRYFEVLEPRLHDIFVRHMRGEQ